ncbi:MAG: HAD-IB family phosphatase [Acidimicrobiales bacterium]|nr:HAD-IB family phosphatase [Acidimicrobiales bacterium]
MIRENLAGKRIAITGSTGFLGTALVERLLRQIPDCHLVLIVRPGRRGAEQRIRREILKNDAFDRLRELHGEDFDDAMGARFTAVAGDVGRDGLGLDDEGRAALASCDIVIHSAATVSFDSPLDLAVEINLLGPVRIAHTLHELGVSPHLVAVSTCYVAGSRRGDAPEIPVDASPFFVDVDWRTEVEAARQARTDVERQSREPERLVEFRSRARAELGAAGIPALSAKTEQLRNRWVTDQMAERGRARASSLGFPDAYAYTKSLGEKALHESKGDLDVSVVRPSIIESALAEPFPGWIRGFRMAEPIIISYAQGLLREFPGVPEGTVDIIPVDQVVAAIVMVAARGVRPDGIDGSDIVQVASGSVAPLKYAQLVGLAKDWFQEHPLYDNRGQPIAVADFAFPGRGRVQGQLNRAKAVLDRTEKILHRLPLRGEQAQFAASLDERREQVDRALGYVELYGAYAECEALYTLDRLLTDWEGLDAADQEAFAFDPRVMDWEHYVTQVHFPSVIAQGRVKSTPGAKVSNRTERLRGQVLDPKRQLAAFDLENTLIASNVVTSYAWIATRRLPYRHRARFVAQLIAEGPALLALDRRDRSDFLRSFYRRYEHAPVSRIETDAAEMFSDLILTKSFPAAIRRVREHRAAGQRTLLITGALDFVVNPLKPLFDDIISAQLGVQGPAERPVYDGKMTGVPPTGEARYQALADYARANDIDLREAVAYADSSSDLPMLEAVGFPVAVNPETKLAALARKRGWLVEHFAKSPGGPPKYVPLPPRSRS